MIKFLEKAIIAISPGWAANRAKSRHMAGIFDPKLRKYEAASMKPRMGGWGLSGSGPNSELSAAMLPLRDRSRDMVRNDGFAWRAARIKPANVVGGGIRPSIAGASDPQKQVWKDWAESTICDFDGRLTFYGIQRLIMRSVLVSGDVFIRQRRMAGMDIPLQLQLLEADFLDESKDGTQLSNGNIIMQGIEFNREGKRVAYWMFEQHPGENMVWRKLNSVRIPADEILHVYYMLRPGQIRGVPSGHAAMTKLKDFKDFEGANLIRQKIAACFAAFVTSSDEPRPGETVSGAQYPIERVEPGMVEYLPPGTEIHFGTPPTADNYGEYAKTTLHGVAAGFDVTYEQLTNDFSNVNFSSGRMGWIENGKIIAEYQTEMMIPLVCDPVFSWFVTAASLAGKVPAKLKASWTAPKREMIDPLKEVKGMVEMVKGGFLSWQSAVRRLGYDPDLIYNEIVADNKQFDKAGLKLSGDGRHQTKGENPTPDGKSTDDGDSKKPIPAKKSIKAKPQ